MRVIGTAGHVDHGKSTLVEALTGINPDRLREEQERQMTIDLGFAWLDLPSGQTVGVIDVPGHIDFIENMLAGVGGIDAAILVIAGDEGIMPQTREHLAILELLGVDKAAVALTKIDMVEDPGWLDLVQEDVAGLLLTTALGEAPIVRVSAKTGEGLQSFIQALDRVVETSPARLDLGRPRLSVDRSFTISGFGTVVTGTLLDGSFSVGDEVQILPSGLKGRIRGLQTHHASLETAHPGSRLAMNLSGIDADAVRRGDAVVHPGTVEASSLLDVHVRQLEGAPSRLKHNQEIKLFLGAAQRMGRVRILGRAREISPGQEGWLQIELEEPVAAAKGDRYILRRPSPPMTLGGGQVVDPHPARRHRLRDTGVVEALEVALAGSPEDQLETAVTRLGTPTLSQACVASGLSAEQGREAAESLLSGGRIRTLLGNRLTDDTRLVSPGQWRRWSTRLVEAVEAYHRNHPMRGGMPQEAVKSRLDLDQEVFGQLLRELVAEGALEHDPPELRSAGFKVQLDDDQLSRAEELLGRFEGTTAPPSTKEAFELAGEDIVRHLVQRGSLVALSREVLMSRAGYDSWVQAALEMLEAGETLTVAQVRDRFGSSRKYVLAFLEHLDAEGITLREGDIRRLNPARRL